MGTTDTPIAPPEGTGRASFSALLSWLVVALSVLTIAVIVFLLLGGQLGS
jgi:hypothetical protein